MVKGHRAYACHDWWILAEVHKNPALSTRFWNIKTMIGTKITPMAWLLRIPNLGGSRPIIVPTIKTDIPMNPVLTKTSEPTKTMTLMIICCNGIAA